MYSGDIWGDRNVLLSCEMQRELLRGEGCVSFLPLSQLHEFHKGDFFREKCTSKAMVMHIPVHLGECPSGDIKCVVSEHGRLYSISEISRQMTTLPFQW